MKTKGLSPAQSPAIGTIDSWVGAGVDGFVTGDPHALSNRRKLTTKVFSFISSLLGNSLSSRRGLTKQKPTVGCPTVGYTTVAGECDVLRRSPTPVDSLSTAILTQFLEHVNFVRHGDLAPHAALFFTIARLTDFDRNKSSRAPLQHHFDVRLPRVQARDQNVLQRVHAAAGLAIFFRSRRKVS